jgi:hypothetical protein
MKLRDIFATDVTRDIPPVVYFHEQDPEKLEEEVSEYIVTGGYPEGHPHHQRVPRGIHEHFVRLLTHIREDLERSRGPELPTSWISGFYGSGKSSFAKLLGLSLDGVELPDGTELSERLLERDTSPKSDEFRQAWEALQAEIDPMAVVFDLGATARGSEPVHEAVVREVQDRLGYSPTRDPNVADAELKLEREGDWDAFTEAVVEEVGERWSEIRDSQFVEDDFSRVMHRLYPDRFETPMSWRDTRMGVASETRSAAEAVEAIEDMLDHRAPNKTLFVVVDEVSQYLHDNHERMLKLQSFASALGQRLQGRAWLLVTGQEKLEEQNESTVIGRLKDRFPPKFRVHLDATNIRDVVHKRLLRKDDAHRDTLRDLFDEYRQNLQLYAYECEGITEQDFLEVYPMLPNHIDLLMSITSAMRARSTQTQGDDHAIRGLMQMLGELFRERELADEPLGRLVTLEDIYEVQSSALSNDTQNTMARILDYTASEDDALAARVAKAVALLQLIQDEEPTSAELVAKCLYDRLDRGDHTDAIEAALERLRDANYVTYSEKHGYKLQSSAGQEWVKEREDIGVSYDDASELVREQLRFLVDNTARPSLGNVAFEWEILYSDGRQARDAHVKNPNSRAVATVDFRLVRADDRSSTEWIQRSDEQYEERFLWVVGRSDHLIETARELGRSQRMVTRYEARQESLEPEELRLLSEEQARESTLKQRLREAVDEAWMRGAMYFQGQKLEPSGVGQAFSTALHGIVDARISKVYPHFDPERVTETELEQLFDTQLAGVSQKFLEQNIGILSMDAGSHTVACEGEIPRRIAEYVEQSGGAGGSALLEHFESPPYGYHRSLIKACLVGLLRAGKIEIQPQGGQKITSYQDPGTRDLFNRLSDLRNASFVPASDDGISNKDRVRICKFFETRLDRSVAREDEAIADAVFETFPRLIERHDATLGTFDDLPDAVEPPSKLRDLGEVLRGCLSSRQIEPTVERVERQLDRLQDGIEFLQMVEGELDDDACETLREAGRVLVHAYDQLQSVDAVDVDVEETAESIEDQLGEDFPWRNCHQLEEHVDVIRNHYGEVRRRMLDEQGEAAEQARKRIKMRDGYRDLSNDESHEVLRPIARACVDTDADALYPDLATLQNALQADIPDALEEAHDRLDALLEDGDETPVRKLRIDLRHKTIESEEQLDALLDNLEKRAREYLEEGAKVRFV